MSNPDLKDYKRVATKDDWSDFIDLFENRDRENPFYIWRTRLDIISEYNSDLKSAQNSLKRNENKLKDPDTRNEWETDESIARHIEWDKKDILETEEKIEKMGIKNGKFVEADSIAKALRFEDKQILTKTCYEWDKKLQYSVPVKKWTTVGQFREKVEEKKAKDKEATRNYLKSQANEKRREAREIEKKLSRLK